MPSRARRARARRRRCGRRAAPRAPTSSEPRCDAQRRHDARDEIASGTAPRSQSAPRSDAAYPLSRPPAGREQRRVGHAPRAHARRRAVRASAALSEAKVDMRRTLALVAVIALAGVPAPPARARRSSTRAPSSSSTAWAATPPTSARRSSPTSSSRRARAPDARRVPARRTARPAVDGQPVRLPVRRGHGRARPAGRTTRRARVRENADKLAGEVDEVASNTQRRVILVGYSMGGAIIRTYLATAPDGRGRARSRRSS